MTGPQFWIFLAMITKVTLLVFGYLFFRLVIRADLSRLGRIAVGTSLGGAMILLFVARPLFQKVADPRASVAVTALQWISFIAMGYVATLFFLVFSRDLALLASRAWRRGASRIGRRVLPRSVGAEAVDLDRRRMLSRSAVFGLTGLSAGMTGVGFGQAQAGPGVFGVKVPIGKLPPGFEGYRIAQISDLHIGPTIDRAYVERVVEVVNGLDADLVVLTGDLVDGSVAQLGRDFEPLRTLRSRDGLFACTGNHEYYSGALEWIDHMRSAGIQVLLNEHVLIRRAGLTSELSAAAQGAEARGLAARDAADRAKEVLVLAGVTDYRASRVLAEHATDPRAAAKGAPDDAVKVLLAHQPASCFEADKAGFDLQLSGHTHAGQFFPFAFFVRIAHPYIKGLNRHNDRMWVYVNQGTGYWGPPNRLGRPAEITLLELTRGQA